jgi:Cu(I)/Ag(I) efflux system periplasmic protein CusF
MAAMPGMSDKGAMGAMRGGSAATTGKDAASTGKDAASKQPMAEGGHVDAPGAHGKPAGGAMASMPGMSGAAAGGSKAEAGAPHSSGSAERSMGAMPGMGGKGGMEGKAGMGGMEGKSGEPDKARLSGTGTVKVVDKAAARVKLTHDPIAAAGWPGMTIVFRLSDAALADRVQAGDKVSFILSQSASGYVISELQKGPPSPVAKQSK